MTKMVNPAEHPRDLTDKAFRLGLMFKAIHGSLETIGGILLLFVTPGQLNHWAQRLTGDELGEKNGFVSRHIVHSASTVTRGTLFFASLYLLSHGLIKLVLVVEVWRDRLWAYIALITVTALFVLYQLYMLAIHGLSIALILLTIFDLIVIYLTTVEYRRQVERRA